MTAHTILVARFSVLAGSPVGLEQVRALVHEAAVNGGLSAGHGRWNGEPLGHVLRLIQTGPFGSLLHKSDYVVGGTPLINPINLKNGVIRPDPNKSVSEETLARLQLYIVERGDVVLGRRGEMGKCAVVTGTEHGWLCGTGSMFLRPIDGIDSRFLALWLRSPGVRRRLSGDAVGSTMANLNQRILQSLPFPVPPLAEQKHIVAKADELLALCDQLQARQTEKAQVSVQLNKAALDAVVGARDPKSLRTSWKRIEDNFDLLYDRVESVEELKQAIIDLALQGRLLSSHGDVAGVERLVSEAAKERAAAPQGRNPSVEPYLDAGVYPFDLPRAWRWVRWGALTLGIESGWSPQCKPTPASNNEWGVLKVSAVSWFRFNPLENKALPAGRKPRREAEVRPGDFLMSRANTADLVGRSVVVEDCPDRLMMSDKILRCHFAKGIDPWFVNYVNRARSTREHYRTKASGTSSSMKNISRDVVGDVPVPLPPPDEQRQIVHRLDMLMAFCDKLEIKLKHAHEHGERLMRAVVESLVV